LEEGDGYYLGELRGRMQTNKNEGSEKICPRRIVLPTPHEKYSFSKAIKPPWQTPS
jgi:hypothetical protein